jgi:type I site-specific restriction-modification system R (restriction) subunit
MKDKEVIAKIKKLKQIEPRKEWLVSMREKLDYEIEEKPAFWRILKTPQVAGVLASLVVIVAGPLAMLKAAEDAVLGDALYTVKRFNEEAQMKLAGVDSVDLQTELATRRSEELYKVNLDKLSSDIEKNENTQKAIENLRDNLTAINSRIRQKANQNSQQIAEVAERTKQIEENIDKTKEEAPAEIQDELAELEKTLEEIRIFASLDKNKEETATNTPEMLNENSTTTISTTTENEEDTEDEENKDIKETEEKESTGTTTENQ